MAILTLQDTQLAYGELPLLDRAALAMESGKRLGLIGRNGTGKSSLLGAIAGRVALDDGELRIRDGLRIAMIEQEPVLPLAATLKQSLLGRASVHQEHKLNEYLDRFVLNPNGAFRPEWERAAERGKCGQVRVPVWRRCAVAFTGRAHRFQSARMPFSLMTRAQRARSVLTCAANVSGVLAITSSPSLANRSVATGSRAAFTM
jgi:energy-coupling factor transporter ATP-binding protein EcfA2